MLQKQASYNIQPVAECHCQTNFHKKLVTGNNDIPCMHTITKTTIIKMNYPKLNTEYFINGNNFSTVENYAICCAGYDLEICFNVSLNFYINFSPKLHPKLF